ncbi:putative cytoplasmic protein [Salmonella enterica subsp. enterica]|uniref:Putative cytoplasmic protein n=1 Tax=Salmonella enterica I TaxID=59201 RepID=A0A3S4J818_SALET|nr:putative cytoplasmic protein [Salmonella enterica subsp. enterica]
MLKNRFPDVATHIIAHECFLRGAVITAWAERFRQRLSSLWFVEEEINDDDCRAEWQLLGKNMAGMVAKSVATLGARSQPQNGLFVNRFPLRTRCRR